MLDAMRLQFDRGTILLTELPAGMGPSVLAGAAWDARVHALRAPAHEYEKLCAGLHRSDVAVTDEIACAGLRPSSWTTPELRPYQHAALASWQLSARRGIVALPTGAGKTRVGIAAAVQCKVATLFLVPTRVLLEQWRTELEKFYSGKIGCFGDGEHDLQPVTVTTFESAYRRMPQIGHRFRLMVVDEAHHLGANLRYEALEMSVAEARLGLTATPAGEESGHGQAVNLLGPTVYQLCVGDLTGRYLAEFDRVCVSVDLTPNERAQYDAQMETFRLVYRQFCRLVPRPQWQDFVRYAGTTDAGRKALWAWRAARKLLAYTQAKAEMLKLILDRHHGARVLAFTADNHTAYAVAGEHLVMPITCDIGRRERHDALDRFRRGELSTLVSAQVLNEGIDVPDADVAIVVGGALGEREHIQRIGRLLRPAPGKRAVVYELVTRATAEVHQAQRRYRSLGTQSSAQL